MVHKNKWVFYTYNSLIRRVQYRLVFHGSDGEPVAVLRVTKFKPNNLHEAIYRYHEVKQLMFEQGLLEQWDRRPM
jgi:hypothetical protein